MAKLRKIRKNLKRLSKKLEYFILSKVKYKLFIVIYRFFNLYKKEILLFKYTKNDLDNITQALKNKNIPFKVLDYHQFTKNKYKLRYHVSIHKVIVSDTMMPVHKYINIKQAHICVWHAPGAFKKFGLYYTHNYGEKFGYPSYVIASSSHIITIIANAFNIEEEKVLSLGNSRSDTILAPNYVTLQKEAFYNKYPFFKNKKIYLYAPTMRTVNNQNQLFLDLNFQELHKNLNEDEILLIKKHPFLCKSNMLSNNNINFFSDKIVNCDSENILELTACCDVFITDYSSSIFDAVLLNKPVVLYAEDIDEYLKERGLFINYYKDLPGEIVDKPDSNLLLNTIRKATINHVNYNKFKEFHLEACDGKSTLRIVNFIMQCNK